MTNFKKKEHIESGAIIEAAKTLTNACHNRAWNNGWWKDSEKMKEIIPLIEKQFPDFDGEYVRLLMTVSKLMLQVSEVVEGFEGARKNLKDDHLPHRDMLEVELADAIIRIFDMAGGEGLDLAGAMAEKLDYNDNRADHKIENRAKEGGKKI